MNVGIIGLGRMGGSIAQRLLDAGHKVIGFDLDEKNIVQAQKSGVEIVPSVADVAKKTSLIWLMVPAGAPVDAVIKELLPHVCNLRKNAIIIDGGNSHFSDSIRRAKYLADDDVIFLDCGTSGGLHGRDIGFSLMVGGNAHAYEEIKPLLDVIAAPHGHALVGPSGAGHYVKMVHNGIEYALLQGYAEGFQLIKEGAFKHAHLDLEQITRVWMHGSIIRSWLLSLTHQIFKDDQTLDTISGSVAESGTGKWTVDDAHKHKVSVPVIEKSLEIRAWSRENGGNFATKVIAMIRNKFGGHAFKTVDKK